MDSISNYVKMIIKFVLECLCCKSCKEKKSYIYNNNDEYNVI